MCMCFTIEIVCLESLVILCTALNTGLTSDQEVQVMFACSVCLKKDQLILQLYDELQAHLGEWLHVHDNETKKLSNAVDAIV